VSFNSYLSFQSYAAETNAAEINGIGAVSIASFGRRRFFDVAARSG